jgi:hypothetical protein
MYRGHGRRVQSQRQPSCMEVSPGCLKSRWCNDIQLGVRVGQQGHAHRHAKKLAVHSEEHLPRGKNHTAANDIALREQIQNLRIKR